MATDLFGRQSGNIPISEMAAGLNSPTNNQVQDERARRTNSGNDNQSEVGQRVFEALQKINAISNQQLEETREQTRAANEFYRSNLKGSRKENNTESGQSTLLRAVADASQGLLKASQTQNSFWVSISGLSDTAQSQISKAFSLSGCCEALAASAANLKKVSARSDVTDASRQAISSISGGGGNNSGGGGGGGGGGLGGGAPNPTPNNNNSRSSTGGGGSPPSIPDMGGAGGRWAVAGELITRGLRFATQQAEQLVNTLDINPAEVFKGALSTVNNYRINVRKLIHAQQGFGETNRELEKSFMDVRSVMDASGQKSEVVRDALIQNMQRGLQIATAQEEKEATSLATNVHGLNVAKKNNILLEKRAARMKSITTSALSTAKMLDMDANSMNNLFMDWNMHLGLSEMHMAEMGRHMQTIARSTGLTGPALEQAMKSTDGVLRRLQKTGSLSIDSAKRTAEFMAAAQKHGFEGAGEMLAAMSSRFELIESKQAPFLRRAAMMSGNDQTIRDLNAGRLLETPTGMKDMMTGMKNLVKESFRPFESELKSIGIKSIEDVDPSQLNDILTKLRAQGEAGAHAASSLELRFKNLGTSVGDVQQGFKALKDAAKTPADRLQEFEQQLANMRKVGIKQSDPEYQRILKLQLEEQNKASLDAFGRLTEYSEKLKASGGRPDDAMIAEMLPKMTNIFGSQEMALKFLKDIPGQAAKAVGDFTQKAKEAGVSESTLNAKLAAKGFGDSFTSPLKDLQKKIAMGDTGAMQAMNELAAETGVKEKAKQDPILTVQEELRTLRNMLEEKLNILVGSGGLIDTIGAFGMRILAWGTMVLGALTAIAGGIAALGGLQMGRSILGSLLSGVGGLGGMGGGRGGRRSGRRGTARSRSAGGRGTASPTGASGRGSANPRGARGRATSRGGRGTRGGRGRVRGGRGGRGRGSWVPMLATAAASYAAGSWFSGGGEDEGMGDGSVTDLLTQIRDILANCCAGGGLGGGGVSTTTVPSDESYLSDRTLGRMESIGTNLAMAQMGVFAIADVAGDSAKSASKSATKSVNELAKAAAESADDIARSATQSVDDVARAAMSSAENVASTAISSLDDSVRAASNVATSSVAGGTTSVASAAGGGAMPKPPSAGGGVSAAASGSSGAMPKPSSAGGGLSAAASGGALPTSPSAGGGVSAAASGGGGWFKGLRSKMGQAWSTAGEYVSGASSRVNETVNSVYNAGAGLVKKGADAVGVTKALDTVKGSLKSIVPSWLSSSGSNVGGFLKNMVKGVAKYSGPIGAVIESAFAGMDIYETANQKGVSVDDIQKEIGSTAIKSGLGFLGGTLAASLVSAPQAFGIPSWVLSPLAYMGGDWFGRQIGGMISDYIGGPTLGKWIFDLGSSMGWWPSKGARGASTTGPAVEAETKDSPIEAFQVGTKEVLQSGIATLHEGEVVIPKDVWEKIKAVGSGAFGTSANQLLSSLGGVGKALSMAGPISKIAKSPAVQSATAPVAEALSPFVNSFKKVIEDVHTYMSFRHDQPESNLKEFLGITQKQKANRKQISPALEGAFAEDQAREALDAETDLSLKMQGMQLDELGAVGSTIGSQKTISDKMSLMQDDDKSNFVSALTGLSGKIFGKNQEKTSTDSVVDVLNDILSVLSGKQKSTEGVSATLEGAFAKGESTSALEESTSTETNKMSYWATMAGAAVAGPIGAMAGFAADAYKNNIGIGEALNQTVSNIGNAVKSGISYVGMGLFDNEKPSEAEDESTLSSVQKMNFSVDNAIARSMSKSNFSDAFKKSIFTGKEELVGLENYLDKALDGKQINTGNAVPKALGLFDSDKSSEASDSYSDGLLKSIGGSKALDINKYNLDAIEKQMQTFNSEKNVVVEASKALDYERSASEAAEQTKTKEVDYTNSSDAVSSNYMDYRDQLKGDVGTLGLSRYGMESAVMQEKYGSQPSGTSVLPSMDSIDEYLTKTQAQKLDEMIRHLKEISMKIPGVGRQANQVIGAVGDGQFDSTRPGVKNIATSYNNGAWDDFAYPDQSPSSVITEGRGGGR